MAVWLQANVVARIKVGLGVPGLQGHGLLGANGELELLGRAVDLDLVLPRGFQVEYVFPRREILFPTRVDDNGKELVRSFGKLEAFGEEFDFSASVQKAIAGDFGDFSDQFKEVFGRSEALISQFGAGLDAMIVPGLGEEDELGEEGEEGDEPIVRTGELLGDIFVDRLDSLIEIMGEGFRDMIEQLSALVGGLQGAGAGGLTLKIETLDADSFRVFLAGDGGDTIMNELAARRSEQLTDIIAQSEQGGTGE